MDNYIIMIPRCSWQIFEAINSEMAYREICSWYLPDKKIAVMNLRTKETDVFTRELDSNGNLIRIHKWTEKELIKELKK